MSLALAVCLIYCFHGYCPCHTTRIVHTESDLPFLGRSYLFLPEPSAPRVPDNFISSIATQQVLPSNHNNPRGVVITQSTDEPPAYRGMKLQ